MSRVIIGLKRLCAAAGTLSYDSDTECLLTRAGWPLLTRIVGVGEYGMSANEPVRGEW